MYDSEMNELKKKVDKMLLPKSKEYQQGRVDERSHIVGILFGIDRQVAELVKEILNNEKANK